MRMTWETGIEVKVLKRMENCDSETQYASKVELGTWNYLIGFGTLHAAVFFLPSSLFFASLTSLPFLLYFSYFPFFLIWLRLTPLLFFNLHTLYLFLFFISFLTLLLLLFINFFTPVLLLLTYSCYCLNSSFFCPYPGLDQSALTHRCTIIQALPSLPYPSTLLNLIIIYESFNKRFIFISERQYYIHNHYQSSSVRNVFSKTYYSIVLPSTSRSQKLFLYCLPTLFLGLIAVTTFGKEQNLLSAS